MRIFRTIAGAVFSVALLAALVVPGAKADDWNRKTVITFSGPVEIPGVHLKGWSVLPAGTYVFKILDSHSNRHIVQIFSADENTVYATILAIPNYRLRATDKTVMTFRERPAGEPEALRAWFYPGRNWGEEFVYPRAKAVELSKTTDTPIIFTSAELPLEVTKPILTVNEPEVVALLQAPLMAIKPTGEEVDMAAVVTAPPDVELDPAAAALPATASYTMLIALCGFMALAAGLGLRAARKRVL